MLPDLADSKDQFFWAGGSLHIILALLGIFWKRELISKLSKLALLFPDLFQKLRKQLLLRGRLIRRRVLVHLPFPVVMDFEEFELVYAGLQEKVVQDADRILLMRL